MIILAIINYQLTINDIGFGIWTGENLLKKRLKDHARTWYQLLPEVHIYSDKLPKKKVNDILNCSNHLNITFHEQQVKALYLKGTQSESKWDEVQSRHVFAATNLIQQYPDKKWYVLCDDDSYLFPNAIVDFLSDKDSSKRIVYGKIYAPFYHLLGFYSKEMKNHLFAMGGAGIIMSGTLMRDLKPYLPICSHSFTGIMFASDMRLSLCAERFLGVTANSYINNELQHGNGPKITQTKPKYNSAPISYHNIVSPLTIHLWQSHVTTWDDKYIDWSNISMSEITFEYGIEHVMVEMQWGYAMYINGRSKKEDMCITQFEPIFSANDTERLNPREFVQKYQNGFTIRTVCDDDLEEHEIVFDSFLFDEYGCKFRVKCPMVRKFLSNFPGGSSPAKIIYEPTEEV